MDNKLEHSANSSGIDAMDNVELVDALALRADQIRPALGIAANEPESAAWRDATGTGHLYIRGALQSLERISKSGHDPEAAGTAEATVNFAAHSPEGFFGSTNMETAKLAQTILQAEKDGETDLTSILTETSVNTLLVGLNDANEVIAYLASEEDAPNDMQVYAAAFDKVSEHYNAYGAYLNTRLNAHLNNQPGF